MKQKYLLLTMIILIFLFSDTSLSVLAVTPNLKLNPCPQSVTVGGQATINVVIEDVTDLRGANITLNFDAFKLQYVSSADGGFIPSAVLMEQSIDNTNGTVTLDIAGLGASGYHSGMGTGTIITVVLERIATGDTNVTFGSTTLRDKDNITITHTKGDGCLITSLIGDFFPDGCVDFEDLMIFAMAYGSCVGDANWNPVCDLNSDGCIEFEDLMLFAMNYGEGDSCNGCTPPSLPNLSDPGSSLPSPATYTVNWSSVSEATSYKIEESTSPSFSGAQEYTTTGTSKSFFHTVTTATTYYYRVAAINDCGQSGWSNVEDIIINSGINTPTLNDLGTSISSGTSYTVSWSDESGSGATKYTLQEDVLPDFSSAQNYVLTDTSGSFSRIVDSDTTFYYRVRSENDTEQSAWSNTEDILVTPISPPDTPVINDPGSSIPSGTPYMVSWSDESASGANHYQLQEATTTDFSGAQNYSLTTTSKSFTHNTFEDTTYYYRVVAENTTSSQYSDWSNTVDITVNGEIPNAPNLDDPGTEVNSGASYTITWSDESGSGATNYLLQEDTVDNFSSALSYTTSNNFKSFTHSVLSDITYYYRVAAVNINSNGQSGWSTTKSKIVKAVELAEWTVMIYLNGDNALESQVWDDLTEMETVGSKNGVNIIAQMDYASSPGVYRYFVTGSTKGSSMPYYPDDIVSSLSEQNMAEPAVLSDFVNWATLSYPAKKYLLILRGTGEGWKGLLEDTTSSDKMTLEKLVQSLSGINTHLDVLGLDASCMQMTEVVYAIGDGLINPPDYIVGSQEIIWDNGWDYYDILNDLTFDSTYDPATCAEALVYDIGVGDGSPLADTVSAICIPVFMNNVKTVIDDFGNALKNSAYSSNIAIVRALAQSFTGHPEFKDLCHFNELIWDYDVYDCYDQADLIFDFVWDYSNIIDYHSEGLALKNCNGLSIYLPDTPAGYDTEYNSLQFAQDTQWDEFLQNITTVVKPTVTTIGHDSVTKTSATCYGRINSTGGERANRIGIEYQDLTSGGGILDKYQTGDYGDEDFTRGLINLAAGHTYQYRAYADNPTAGRGYGKWKQFVTIPEDPVMPEVSTYDTDQIGSTTATAHGKINSTGGAIISERGFTYGLTEAANTWTASETGSFAEDFFEMGLSGLEPSTTYYIKAFATNTVGTDYGPWDIFTTTEGTPDPDAPEAPTLYDPGTTVESGEQYVVEWSSVSGATSYILQEATQSNFSDAQSLPTTDTSMGVVHDDNNTYTYYYRVAAVNSYGQSGWSNDESITVNKNPRIYRAFLVGANGTGFFDSVAPKNSAYILSATLNNSNFDFIVNDVIFGDEATKQNILQGIDDKFHSADYNDVSYFYYAGHGARLEDISYLCPYDFDGSISSAISISELETHLDNNTESGTKGIKVIFLDSCRSGGFIDKANSENKFLDDEHINFNNDVINIFSAAHSKYLTDSSQYIVLTACRREEKAWANNNVLFPYMAFTKALYEGCGYDYYTYPYWADNNGDRSISLHEAYNYVKDHIPNWLPLVDQNVQIFPWGSDFPIIEY